MLTKIKNLFSEKLWLTVLLLLSVAINLFLAFEVKDLRTKNLLLTQTDEHQIILGKKVPNLSVKNLDDENVEIDYSKGSKPTVIYLYSPDCVWCDRNLQNIKYLYENAKEEYNFVGLTVFKDSASEYVKDKNLEFPVFTSPSDSNRLDYNFRATPSTYVISSEGKVIKYWSGAYGDKNIKDVEGFFGIKLPGISN